METATPVTAIDILLEPDATMIAQASIVNARLLAAFPQGFAFDASHQPHITLLQQFVRTEELESVYGAVERVLASEPVADWKLTAFKYYYVSAPPIGVAGIVIHPTADLLRLQQNLIDAVAPFTESTGTAAAFFTLPGEPDLQPALVPYIETFIPQQVGKNFSPHVSVGVGTIAYLDKMLAEPFTEFSFSPASASVFQLGDFGAARRLLKSVALRR